MKFRVKPQMLVLDCDGTILDTTKHGFRKVNSVLSQVGLPSVSHDFLRRHWGKKMQDILELACEKSGGNDKQFQELIIAENNFVEGYEPTPGLEGILTRVRSVGIFLALVTSRSQEHLKKIFKAVDFDIDHFDYVQTADDHPYHKPSGQVFKPILQIAKDQTIPISSILYFGDTVEYDLRAARNSSPPLNFVAVSSGINTHDEFVAEGVPRKSIVPSVEALPEYIRILIFES